MHKIYMRFERRGDTWNVTFLEADLRTRLGNGLSFSDSDKVMQTAERGGAFKTLADRQDVAGGIAMGRGGIELHLTEAQYRKLK